MRGGVTVRAQDLKTRLPEDMFGEIREMHPLLTPKLTNATIKRAVRDYMNGGARKQRVVTKYGDISNWDVSKVTDMSEMFLSEQYGIYVWRRRILQLAAPRSLVRGRAVGRIRYRLRFGMTDSTFFYLSRG